MKNKSNLPSRRGFLAGLLTGLGAATAVVATAGKTARAGAKGKENKPSGPVLYRRTAEAERYYKTLYT